MKHTPGEADESPVSVLEQALDEIGKLTESLENSIRVADRAGEYWDAFLFELANTRIGIRRIFGSAGFARRLGSSDRSFRLRFDRKHSLRLVFIGLDFNLPDRLAQPGQAVQIEAWFLHYRQRLIAAGESVGLAKLLENLYRAEDKAGYYSAFLTLRQRIQRTRILLSTDLYSDYLKELLSKSLRFFLGIVNPLAAGLECQCVDFSGNPRQTPA